MNPLSLITLVAGLLFISGGLIFRFFPPKKAGWFVGRRSRASLQDPEIWEIANRFAARLLTQLGLLLAAVGVLTFLLPPTPYTGVLAGIGLVILSVFMQFYFTDKHIRKTFDTHGKKRK